MSSSIFDLPFMDVWTVIQPYFTSVDIYMFKYTCRLLNGQISTEKKLKQEDYCTSPSLILYCKVPKKHYCRMIALNGQLELLKWARENGAPWDHKVSYNAAKNGHIEMLEWIRENDAPWNKWTLAAAARNGHLNVLKWAKENGIRWDKYACYYAARSRGL